MITRHDIAGMSFSHFSIGSCPASTLRSDGSTSVGYGPGLHILNMTRQLNEFRVEGQLCDIRLRTKDGTELGAHRVVLAAASPYFSTLFASSFADAASTVHGLPWMSAPTAQNVISFVYTGKILLDYNIVADILAAAEYLMLPQLKQHCMFYMKSTLSMKNICHMKYLAELYQLKELSSVIDDKLSSSASGEVFSDDHLLDLPISFIRGLILDPRFKHIREVDVADFVLRWVERDHKARIEDFPKLFSCVLQQCLPAWYLKKLSERHLTKNLLRDISEDKLEVMKDHSDSDTDIVLIAAASSLPPCVGYIPTEDRWVKFSPLPRDVDLKRRNLKTLYVDGQMYLLITVEESMAWLPSGLYGSLNMIQFWRLNVEINVWTQLEIPHSSSKCFHLTNVGPHICAIGISGSLERYDTTEDIWLPCTLALRTIAYFDTLQFTDGKHLYILNIYSTTGVGHCLQIYDPHSDHWTSLALTRQGNDLVMLTYHLPGRRISCVKDGDVIRLFNLQGNHWATIDLSTDNITCWRWKSIIPPNIFSSHGWTLPIVTLDSLFILNSSSNHCAVLDCDTGYSKLTAPCATNIYLGQKSGCVAKISAAARDRTEVLK